MAEKTSDHPQTIREQLGIKPGDSLPITAAQNSIVIRSVSVLDLAGSVYVPSEGPYTTAELRETAVIHILNRNNPQNTEHCYPPVASCT